MTNHKTSSNNFFKQMWFCSEHKVKCSKLNNSNIIKKPFADIDFIILKNSEKKFAVLLKINKEQISESSKL